MLILEVWPKFSCFQDCESGVRGQKYEKQQPLAPAKYFRFSSFCSLTESAQSPILRIHYSDKTVHTAIHTSLLHTCKIYYQPSQSVKLSNNCFLEFFSQFRSTFGQQPAATQQLQNNEQCKLYNVLHTRGKVKMDFSCLLKSNICMNLHAVQWLVATYQNGLKD